MRTETTKFATDSNTLGLKVYVKVLFILIKRKYDHLIKYLCSVVSQVSLLS